MPKNIDKRTVLIVAIVLAVGCIVVFLVRGGGLSVGDTLKVEFPAPGTTLVKINDKPSKATHLLSASDLWTNTGLILEPGHATRITASGRVNLAIHRMVEAAKLDTRPIYGWFGPEGGSPESVPSPYVKALYIAPDSPEGILLAYLHAEGTPTPGINHPKPDDIKVVGRSVHLTNNTSVARTLWLAVNDAVLADNDESKRAYLEVDKLEDPKVNKRPAGFEQKNQENPYSWTPHEHWEYIRKQRYWGLWYDDNIGFFQVQIDFEPPSPK